MPSPFPGMNPFLEAPALWPGVHGTLGGEIRNALNRLLPGRYFADVEQRVYLCEADDPAWELVIPDVSIHEQLSQQYHNGNPDTATATITPSLLVSAPEMEITEHHVVIRTVDQQRIVAVIEVLSPANKLVGSKGRSAYLTKRKEVMESEAHLVEIDLLRGGHRTILAPGIPKCDYLIALSRVESRPTMECWPTALEETLPTIPIPLLAGDQVIPLDLQAVLHEVHDRSGYVRRLDYSQPVPPPELRAESIRWVRECLGAGARR